MERLTDDELYAIEKWSGKMGRYREFQGKKQATGVIDVALRHLDRLTEEVRLLWQERGHSEDGEPRS